MNGEGTERFDNPAMKQRARAKLFLHRLILPLIDIAKENNNPKMVQRLWNTYHCQNEIICANGKVHGRYCGNRICIICNRIRKARIINDYYPAIKDWKEPHLVLLTAKSVLAHKLSERFDQFTKNFQILINRFKTKFQRGKDIKLVGIRSMECNFNPQKQTYNPHFHVIVPDARVATVLKREWGILWEDDEVKPYLHPPRKIWDLEKGLIELVKYCAKFFTDPEGKTIKTGKKNKIPPKIYLNALYNILCATANRRLFQSFGFRLNKNQTGKKIKKTELDNFEIFTFDKRYHDWVNTETGEVLTGYQPTGRLLWYLNNQVDTELK